MEGQLSFFPEEQKTIRTGRKKKEKCADPSQTFDERMKRFWHYMENRGMHEQWIETSVGEIRIIIDALADYCDIIAREAGKMDGYPRAVWEERLKRIEQIQEKLEESSGYSRDQQLVECMKRKHKKDSDVGEDALVIIANRTKQNSVQLERSRNLPGNNARGGP